MSQKCPRNLRENPRTIPGTFPDISKNAPGIFLCISWTFPGNFPDSSRKFPGNFRDISGTFRDHFQENIELLENLRPVIFGFILDLLTNENK